MDRLTQSLWRGVEELVPSVAEGTSAVFNLPMLLGAFQPPKARRQGLPRHALDDHGYILSYTVILFHPKVFSWFSAPEKNRVGPRG